MNKRTRLLVTVLVVIGALLLLTRSSGCFQKRARNRTEAISQTLNEQKIKTDNLRKAMRFLAQVTPFNREQASKEVQLELNTWIQTVDRGSVNYSASNLLRDLPPSMLDVVGCGTPIELQFSTWDVDYLYGSRMMNKLSKWIVESPLRDLVVSAALERQQQGLDSEAALRLEHACKLFDWTVRNVGLEPTASSVEEMTTDPDFSDDPENPVSDDGIGYGYLPWETLLFSFGDYIERGRVFTALARQRGIETAWVSVQQDGQPGKIWAIGVVIGDSLLLFEPKMGLPIFDPDTGDFATLDQARSNERILRRLKLPGQFEYALDSGELTSVELLIDVPPTAASARMKMLQNALLSDERMVLFQDLDAIQANLQRVSPEDSVRLWQLPLMAQVQAFSVRNRLRSITPYTLGYLAKHGVWLLQNPAAQGRLLHLNGEFESTLDEKGALRHYMDTRVAEQIIADLDTDPEVQQQLGVARELGEPIESYQMRVQQMQYILRKSKIDASFLLALLHFDRGNFAESKSFFERGLRAEGQMSNEWLPLAHYGLARIYEAERSLEEAAEELAFEPSPQEAGNRMRLRYLRRIGDE